MSRFNIKNLEEHSINIKQKLENNLISEKPVEIIGRIINILSYKNDLNTIFNIETVNGNILTCIMNFDLEISHYDNIHGFVTRSIKLGSNGDINDVSNILHTFILKPLIQVGFSSIAIKDFIKRTLISTGCGNIITENVYNKLEELSEIAKNIELRRKTILKNKGKINEIEKIDAFRNTDGGEVAYYISNISIKFYEKKQSNELLPLTESGLKLEQSKTLLREWYYKKQLRRIKLLGLTIDEINKSDKSLDELYNILITNPYKIPFISIEKANDIFKLLCIEIDPFEKTMGEIVRYIYQKTVMRGWTCLPYNDIAYKFTNIHTFKNKLETEYDIVYYSTPPNSEGKTKLYLYLKYQESVENYVAIYLNKLIIKNAEQYDPNIKIYIDKIISSPESKIIPPKTIVKPIIPYFKRETLVKEQIDAVIGALNGVISFITGGAGTGKTSLLDEITNSLKLNNIMFQLSSFMGVAVEKMNEITNGEFQVGTLHRLIATEINVPKFDVLIIDEAGMLDINLFYKFIKTFNYGFKIIFLGDINQLPPIGWGRLIKQIVDSKRVPIYKLIENHRIKKSLFIASEAREQGIEIDKKNKNNDAVILNNANWLVDEKRDLSLPFNFIESDGFSVLLDDDPDIQTEYIKEIINGLKEEDVLEQDICIICPYNKELDEYNRIVQEIYRPNEKEIISNGKRYKIGDQVMSISNNYNAKIFNGTEGIIEELTEESCIIKFKNAKYSFKWPKEGEYRRKSDFFKEEDWEDKNLSMLDIELSFAATINANQGKEKKHCITVLPKRVYKNGDLTKFVNINSLYTAITRSKETVWIVSSEDVIQNVASTRTGYRCEMLSTRLKLMRNNELEDKLNFLTDPEYVTSIILDDENDDVVDNFDDDDIAPDW